MLTAHAKVTSHAWWQPKQTTWVGSPKIAKTLPKWCLRLPFCWWKWWYTTASWAHWGTHPWPISRSIPGCAQALCLEIDQRHAQAMHQDSPISTQISWCFTNFWCLPSGDSHSLLWKTADLYVILLFTYDKLWFSVIFHSFLSVDWRAQPSNPTKNTTKIMAMMPCRGVQRCHPLPAPWRLAKSTIKLLGLIYVNIGLTYVNIR